MFLACLWKIFFYAGLVGILGLCGLVGLLLFLRSKIAAKRALQNQTSSSPNKIRLAFFHPKCNAGGGGEKVLWCMVDSLMNNAAFKNVEVAIYTDGNAPDEEILKKAEDRFLIKLPQKPLFVRVDRGRLIDPDLYPVFTMLGQIVGTLILTADSLSKYVPDYFIDTTGLAFSYWLAKFLVPSCKVGAYVHYPFISQEMLNNIIEKKKRYNNNTRIADSPILSAVKIYYYKTLVYLYGLMGNNVDFAWANSTWTTNHMRAVWPKWGRSTNNIETLYPPCNVAKFSGLAKSTKKNVLISFAQYRPEKNHRLQLEVFKAILQKNPGTDLKFYVIGSCRGPEDDGLLNGLREYAKEIGVQDKVEFFVNLPLNTLLELFDAGSYAIHTMEAEHFGIAVVEMMAAGLAVIAHNSAGPKLDIIRERKENPVGFLALNKEDYIEHLDYCVKNANKPPLNNLIARARSEVSRFSDEKFKELFEKDMRKILKS